MTEAGYLDEFSRDWEFRDTSGNVFTEFCALNPYRFGGKKSTYFLFIAGNWVLANWVTAP